MNSAFFLSLLRELLLSAAATAFFAFLIRTPLKTVPVSAIAGGISYALCSLLTALTGHGILSYFPAALFAALAGETAARIYRMPSTIFVFPAIIPLVPGLGLYRSMLALIRSDTAGFLTAGSRTVFISCAIASAVAVVSLLARRIFRREKSNTAISDIQEKIN